MFVRYRRQLTLEGFGAAGQQKLFDGHVVVVGAGGLGSPALLYLAAAGVGRITVIDDDVVELSNLHRQIIHREAAIGQPKVESAQQEMLARNSSISVTAVQSQVTQENAVQLLGDADVVMDGSDNFAARYAVSRACAVLGIPHVWASILGFDAQLSVFWAGHGPVYNDVFPTAPPEGSVPSCAQAGVLGPLVGVAGTAMALEAVKLLSGVGEPLMGKIAYFSGMTGQWEYIPISADPAVAQQLAESEPAREECGQVPTARESAPAHSQSASADSLPSGDADEPASDATDDAMWLDVREPYEYETFHIPGAHNVPLSQLQQSGVDEHVRSELDKHLSGGSDVVVYCAAGVRSMKAIEILAAAGLPTALEDEGDRRGEGADAQDTSVQENNAPGGRLRNYPGGINAWFDAQQ